MKKEFSKKAELKDWIDDIISYDDSIGLKQDLGTKIEVMEAIIQLARFSFPVEVDRGKNATILRVNPVFKDGKAILLPFGQDAHIPSGVPRTPKALQIPLSLFLLVQHGKDAPVISIIDKFITEIRPSLSLSDFDKTATGVTRCFTNTRFAAMALRNYGLLKFTQKEAFKTWELSFLGIIVTAFFYFDGWRSLDFWDKDVEPGWKIDDVIQLLAKLEKGALAKILVMICDLSNSRIDFATFEEKFDAIQALMRRHSCFVKDKESSLKREKVSTFVRDIESIPAVEKFMQQFRLRYEMTDFNRRIQSFLL